MQVNRPSNVPGYGQGPGAADRSNKDGQRRNQGGRDEPKKRPEAKDQVQLHTPEPGANPAPARPAHAVKPIKPGLSNPPLDLSA